MSNLASPNRVEKLTDIRSRMVPSNLHVPHQDQKTKSHLHAMCEDDTSAWHGTLPQGYQTKRDYFNVLLQRSRDSDIPGFPAQNIWTPPMIWMTRHWIRQHHISGDSLNLSTFPLHDFLDTIGFANRGTGQLDAFLRDKASNKLKHKFEKMRLAGLLDHRGCWTKAAEVIFSHDWDGYLQELKCHQAGDDFAAGDRLDKGIKAEAADARSQHFKSEESTSVKGGHQQIPEFVLSTLSDMRREISSHNNTTTTRLHISNSEFPASTETTVLNRRRMMSSMVNKHKHYSARSAFSPTTTGTCPRRTLKLKLLWSLLFHPSLITTTPHIVRYLVAGFSLG
jgi:hypothetical protein